MDTAEALALITAAANLTLSIEKFVKLAEELRPLLRRKAAAQTSQSGGPLSNT